MLGYMIPSAFADWLRYFFELTFIYAFNKFEVCIYATFHIWLYRHRFGFQLPGRCRHRVFAEFDGAG